MTSQSASSLPVQRDVASQDTQAVQSAQEPPQESPNHHHFDSELYAQHGPLEQFLAKGELLEGKFKIAEEIGRGGMGFVYRGVDLSLNREIAVKILPPHYNNDESVVGRFRREARAMASLDHPNIVTVYSIGYEHGLHYFAMKLLHGETLAHTIKRVARGVRAPLEVDEMIDLMIQACNGLEHAHSKSLLHRDIKPGNLMLSAGGSLTIMDFGIVKDLGGTDSIGLKTAHGKIFGTPEYMPPEQAMGKGDYSPASDLYALAVVGYELLCGELPYVADTPIGIIIQHIRAPIPPLKGRATDRYPLIESIFHKALSKDPRARYESAHELRSALSGVRTSVKRPQVQGIDPTPVPQVSTVDSAAPDIAIDTPHETTSIDELDVEEIQSYQEPLISDPTPHPPPLHTPRVAEPLNRGRDVSTSRTPIPQVPTTPTPSVVPKRDTKPVTLQRASKRPGHYKRPILKRKK